MKETGTNSKKFIWRQRIGFGISDYACNLAYLMVNTYLLIFYTDVAGIPAASAAFMFLITKFIDAFTDYMVGALVDRTNTKMGRNRPWMLAGARYLRLEWYWYLRHLIFQQVENWHGRILHILFFLLDIRW